MAPRNSGMRKESYRNPHGPRGVKRKREDDDLETLIQKVAESDVTLNPEAFIDLPLSSKTQSGLEASHFKSLTAIQSKAIPTALKEKDVLGAAKTGSGKTLAFLIPVLENLYRKRWTSEDGLGALIVSPTRELAIQIFEVLRKVGRYHTFSAGLVIGGKDLRDERQRMGRMNILVATPGRILQHMDQSPDLEMHNLQILVLDEADRIMDMGFRDTVDAMIDHLPPNRQTLMFSATQTKRVSDLARLSLRDPEFVAVHEDADSATPATLQQNYVVTPLPEKLDVLWSFIRANLKKKILVFLSSGKQVRFVYESLRHLQPGISLLHLHGRQKQTARLDITTRFSRSLHACLLATDVAARGLDFPAVDWVVQVDCPEDADTYIHRVGRTARYERHGRAVLFLDPSEEDGMLHALEKKKVLLEKINVRSKKMQATIRNQLQNMCFKDPELKYLGQKAFSSYVRSVHLQPDKEIFKIRELDLEGFAASLGLPGTPRVKFVRDDGDNEAKKRKNAPRQLLEESSSSDEEGGEKTKKSDHMRTKYDRMFKRRNQDVLAEHYAKMIDLGDDDEEEGGEEAARGMNGGAAPDDGDGGERDFLSVKRRFEAGDRALDEQNATMSSSSDYGSYEEQDKEERSATTGEEDSTKKKKKHPTNSEAVENSNKQRKVVQLSSRPDDPVLVIDSKRREKLARSRKKLLRFKGRGTHLVFDEDDDLGHEKVYYQEEGEFARNGRPEEQRDEYLRAEMARTAAADVLDKEEAKRKRREKKEKRKMRDRAEITGGMTRDEGGAHVSKEVHIPTLLESDFEDKEDDNILRDDDDDKSSPRERRKRFEQHPESDRSQGGDHHHHHHHHRGDTARSMKRTGRNGARSSLEEGDDHRSPQTLEDLESMAVGLLGR